MQTYARADAALDPGLPQTLQHLQISFLRKRKPPRGRSKISPPFLENNLVRNERRIGRHSFLRHQLDRLLASRQRMLDGVRSRFDCSLNVKRLRIHCHFQSQLVRLRNRGLDLLGRKVASQLDDIRTFMELLPHRLSPIIWPRGQPRCAHQSDDFIGSVLRRVSALTRDECARRKHPWPRNPILSYPPFQPERHISL